MREGAMTPHPSHVRIVALALLGLGLATSAWTMPVDHVDWVHPTTTHGVLATLGLLGLVIGGRQRGSL